ncbi:Hydrogenase expression/formation protein [Paraburkholderia piptadeniae]|uniref:Hydrogenase n=2 Tax=Paraburkholderia TaxID=1822464 RepID=A0A7X1TKX2_9BURK|nr:MULTISPECIES: hydrogenase [Paraburkholderia]MPW22888.1 hydrogenase [Paraburkholderia franconis]SIT52203.1 Hydrogenase expression/formation protein [Paraburkholderia piptadeniae]
MTTQGTSAASTLECLRELLLKQGFLELQNHTFDSVAVGARTLVVLPLGNPARHPEFLDLTVVLPEIVRQFGPDSFRAAFAIPPASAAIANRFGVLRHPALIFLRERCYLGAIEGLRDRQDYLQCFTRMRTELPQPVPIQLSVYGARS